MTRIHDDEVNKTSELSLLHDIINPPKRTKNLKSRYSNILHGCMNTRKVRSKFKDFLILLNSGCSSMIVMGRMVKNIYPEKVSVMQWQTQAGNIITNLWLKWISPYPHLAQ